MAAFPASLPSWLSDNINHYYSYAFAGAVSVVLVCEGLLPFRHPERSLWRRWFANASLFVAGRTIFALLLTGGAMQMAAVLRRNPWGLLNHASLPPAIGFAGGVLALDLLRYGIHCAAHRYAWFWRLHQIHHCDPEFDATTGIRSHPLEELFVFFVIQLPVMAILAPPPLAVAVGEFYGLTINFLVHANIAVPSLVDGPVRSVFVTPGMHRIHHWTDISDQNHNLGVIFSFWDRIFGTYYADSATGVRAHDIGLAELNGDRCLSPLFLLGLPFRDALGTAANSRLAPACANSPEEDGARALQSAGGEPQTW